MTTPRDQTLDCLLGGRWADVAVARDWMLLRGIAALAESDAPLHMARTDPALFAGWRDAVTRFRLGGWVEMTPARIDDVMQKARNYMRLNFAAPCCQILG
jgi:hypothetical protein